MKSFGILQQMNDMLLGTILGYFKRKQFKNAGYDGRIILKGSCDAFLCFQVGNRRKSDE